MFCRKFLLVDPTDDEERIMNGRMMMAMNIHREVCGAVMGGGVCLETDHAGWFALYTVCLSNTFKIKCHNLWLIINYLVVISTSKGEPSKITCSIYKLSGQNFRIQ